MKPPEEIKKDAATCLTRPRNSECNRFALYKECAGDCGYVIKELYDLVLQLESRLAQVERERDAAVHELKIAEDCYNCKHNYACKHDGYGYRKCSECGECPCSKCDSGESQYEWRGVCAENTEEPTA